MGSGRTVSPPTSVYASTIIVCLQGEAEIGPAAEYIAGLGRRSISPAAAAESHTSVIPENAGICPRHGAPSRPRKQSVTPALRIRW